MTDITHPVNRTFTFAGNEIPVITLRSYLRHYDAGFDPPLEAISRCHRRT